MEQPNQIQDGLNGPTLPQGKKINQIQDGLSAPTLPRKNPQPPSPVNLPPLNPSVTILRNNRPQDRKMTPPMTLPRPAAPMIPPSPLAAPKNQWTTHRPPPDTLTTSDSEEDLPPPLPPKRPRPSAPLLPISPPSWATPSRSRRSSPPAYPAPTWSATPGPTLLLTRQMSQLATSLDLIHGNRPASELTADEHLRAQTLSLRLAQLMDQLTMHLESQRKERQRARLPQRRPLLPAFFHAIASRRDRSATTPTRSSNPEPELPKT